MKRLFAWKGHLIVADSMGHAWEILRLNLLDTEESAPRPDEIMRARGASDGTYDMETYEREHREYQADGFDDVDPFEYLHPVDPDEFVEMTYGQLQWKALLNGPVLGRPAPSYEALDEALFGMALSEDAQMHLLEENGAVVFSRPAHWWAEALPVGFFIGAEH